MRRLTMTLTAAALILGTMAVGANAQTQSSGAASFHAQVKNATQLKEAACRGFGPLCLRGFIRACGPFRCWCRPCYCF